MSDQLVWCNFYTINRTAINCFTITSEEVVRQFHVGDAPMDMKAAEAAGVVPIGVTTGVYSEKDLMDCCKGGQYLFLHV